MLSAACPAAMGLAARSFVADRRRHPKPSKVLAITGALGACDVMVPMEVGVATDRCDVEARFGRNRAAACSSSGHSLSQPAIVRYNFTQLQMGAWEAL
jgi:hypothetical protein